jgi:hypothetical protein
LVEAILGRLLTRRNFRRRVLELEFLAETEGTPRGDIGPHGCIASCARHSSATAKMRGRCRSEVVSKAAFWGREQI